ncbi:PREDICTED: protein SLOW GREEN 1, chloroplastic [Tarenaya hassleriana]|uniref:protein SLOW GREEN 1, chloroplastic n=1 Tax=Tarenaya hassleriana TaxID=28532 RepID=UPI00053C5FF5|nr:PREDICTED: protein SLOW GREEN 1, chloroplastic [Tarenaya hassleriana]
MFSSLSTIPSSPLFSFVAVKAAAPPLARPLPLRQRGVRACSNHDAPTSLFVDKFKSLAKTAVFIGAAVSVAGKFPTLPAKAEYPVTTAEEALEEEVRNDEKLSENEPSSLLSELLDSNGEAVEKLRSLLQQKLENGEDEEALKLLERLVAAQPEETEWKFLMARVLSEMGRLEDARKVFDEILDRNPLSFEALFENALLMDRCGEGESVMKRLEDALSMAEAEKKVKEARDVKLIMAQMQFLQKKVEEALKSYEELTKEDPKDFRPYFCRGMIYSLLDKNAEAKEQFAKYRELSPKKFEVEGYLRTPLSRMNLFGTNEEN